MDPILSNIIATDNGSLIVNPEIRDTGWAFATCPDVDECLLKVDDCHPNATCINTNTSYDCTCHKGFMGNGRDTCNRT